MGRLTNFHETSQSQARGTAPFLLCTSNTWTLTFDDAAPKQIGVFLNHLRQQSVIVSFVYVFANRYEAGDIEVLAAQVIVYMFCSQLG